MRYPLGHEDERTCRQIAAGGFIKLLPGGHAQRSGKHGDALIIPSPIGRNLRAQGRPDANHIRHSSTARITLKNRNLRLTLKSRWPRPFRPLFRHWLPFNSIRCEDNWSRGCVSRLRSHVLRPGDGKTSQQQEDCRRQYVKLSPGFAGWWYGELVRRGIGAGVFILGRVFFEIPSNLILLRVGARVWLARIVITWGIIVVGLAWVHPARGFYALRFLLGAGEAGLLPGVIYYPSTAAAVRYTCAGLAPNNVVAFAGMCLGMAGLLSTFGTLVGPRPYAAMGCAFWPSGSACVRIFGLSDKIRHAIIRGQPG